MKAVMIIMRAVRFSEILCRMALKNGGNPPLAYFFELGAAKLGGCAF